MCPVDLGLLARQCFETVKGLRWFSEGRLTRNKRAESDSGAAGIATVLDHLKQSTRAQVRVLLELLDDERHEGIGHRRRVASAFRLDPRLPQHALHSRVVHPSWFAIVLTRHFSAWKRRRISASVFLWDHGSRSLNGAGERAAIEASDGVPARLWRGSRSAQTGARRYKRRAALRSMPRFLVFHLGPFRRRRTSLRDQ